MPTANFNHPVENMEPSEADLWKQTGTLAAKTKELMSEKRYDEALAAIATIRKPLDTFFDKVMVMVEDENVRSSRLAMLQMLLTSTTSIADFSEIVTEKKSS